MNCPNGRTASGTLPSSERTIACEPRLLGKMIRMTLPDGTTLTRQCEDTGGKITEDRIDLYLSTIDEARSWGVKNLAYEVL